MEDLICEYKKTENAIIKYEIYEGFSQRLNQILDQSSLNVPKLNEGRGAWLAKLSGASKPAASDWLLHDKPPKQTRLRALIIMIAKYLPFELEVPVIEAWVLYGSKELTSENMNHIGKIQAKK